MVNGENIGLLGGPGRGLMIEGSHLFVIFVLLFIVTRHAGLDLLEVLLFVFVLSKQLVVSMLRLYIDVLF